MTTRPPRRRPRPAPACPAPGAPARPARLPGLDALRGLAVGLVLLNHAAPDRFGAAGVLGVTVFFALSGWLITGVLMRDLDRGGRIRFGRFYGHRLLRLYPPLLLMLAGYVVVEGVFDLLGQADLVPETLVAALTYTINIPGLPHGSESVYHFWTLAAEEQFYLVWPLVLAWAWRRGWLRATTGVAVAAALAACMVTLLLVVPDVARVYALPTSWGAALLIGCAGYLGRTALAARLPQTARVRRALQAGIVAALLGGTLLTGLAGHPAWYLLGVPAVAVGTVVLISYVGGWRALPTRWLRPAVALGTVSTRRTCGTARSCAGSATPTTSAGRRWASRSPCWRPRRAGGWSSARWPGGGRAARPPDPDGRSAQAGLRVGVHAALEDERHHRHDARERHRDEPAEGPAHRRPQLHDGEQVHDVDPAVHDRDPGAQHRQRRARRRVDPVRVEHVLEHHLEAQHQQHRAGDERHHAVARQPPGGGRVHGGRSRRGDGGGGRGLAGGLGHRGGVLSGGGGTLRRFSRTRRAP